VEADIWINFEGPVVICHSPVMDPLYAVQLQESADAVGFGTVTMDPMTEVGGWGVAHARTQAMLCR